MGVLGGCGGGSGVGSGGGNKREHIHSQTHWIASFDWIICIKNKLYPRWPIANDGPVNSPHPENGMGREMEREGEEGVYAQPAMSGALKTAAKSLARPQAKGLPNAGKRIILHAHYRR